VSTFIEITPLSRDIAACKICVMGNGRMDKTEARRTTSKHVASTTHSLADGKKDYIGIIALVKVR